MNSGQSCTQCGTQITSIAPGGLCPRCLLSGILNPPPEPTSGFLPTGTQEASAAGESSLLSPLRFGNYELLEVIGQGGSSIVWRARQLKPERIVALKALLFGRSASKEEIARFRREADMAAGLHHPNIVPIYEVGEQDGQHFFTMEYVSGANLSEQLRKTALPSKRAAVYLKTVAEAVHYAHQKNVIHRDLKPSNILIDAHDQPRITDFGLAMRLGTDSDVTRTGQVLGSLPYMPPEQAEGKRDKVGMASDIYSLGATLYHVLTTRPPFIGETPQVIFRQVLESEPIAPRKLNPSVPPDLNTICLKCLEKDPSRRYLSAKNLADDLKRFLNNEPVQARPVAAVWRAWRWCWRHPAQAGLAVVLGLMIVTGVAFCFERERAISQGKLVKEQRAEVTRLGHLRQAQIQQFGKRIAGWFSKDVMHLARAAQIREDDELLAQAASALTGLDARLLRMFENVPGSSAAFAPDGRLLVGGAGTNQAMIINTNSVREVLSVGRDGPVCWSPDGIPLQFVGDTNGCVLREMHTKKERRKFPVAEGERVCFEAPAPLAMTPNASRVAALLLRGQDMRIVAWDAATADILGKTNFEASSLAFTPDGHWLAAGGLDGSICVYSLPGLEKVTTLRAGLRRGPIFALAFSPDRVVPYETNGNKNRWLLAAGDKDGGLVVWDVTAGVPRSVCNGSDLNVLSVAFHPDGLTLASAGRVEARLWDVQTGRLLLQLRGQGADAARAVAFSPDGSRLAWCTGAGFSKASVGIWELESHRGVLALRGLPANVRQVWFAPDSRSLAAVVDTWLVGIWELPSGSLRWLIEPPKGSLQDNCYGAFDPNGTRFAFAAGQEARLYDLDKGQLIDSWRLKDGLADRLQFDAHGRLLLVRREGEPDLPSHSRWRLYELRKGVSTPILLQGQQETNWAAYNFEFPAGGTVFLVWNFGRTNFPSTVKAIDVGTGSILWTMDVSPERSEPWVISDPSGRYVGCSVSNNSQLLLLESRTGNRAGGRKEGANALSPALDRFVTASRNGWLLSHRKRAVPRITLGLDWQATGYPMFSPDGQYLAWGTAEGVVLVADLDEVQRRLRLLSSRRP